MKQLLLSLTCLCIASNAMAMEDMQQRIDFLLVEAMYYGKDLTNHIDEKKIIDQLKEWHQTFDINICSEEYRTTLLHRLTANCLLAHANNDAKKIEIFKKLYATTLELFKNNINVNIKNKSENTPLFCVMQNIINKITEKNSESLQMFLETFVADFTTIIDFEIENNEKKITVFDLCGITTRDLDSYKHENPKHQMAGIILLKVYLNHTKNVKK